MVVVAHGALEHHRIAGGNEAALARCDNLVHLQAKGTHVAPRADGLVLVGRAGRLSAIFDHGEIMPPRDFHDSVHLRSDAARVHRHDGARAGRDAVLDVVRIERERTR